MAFHFTLAAVLHYRESIEKREYMTLEKRHHEKLALEEEISRNAGLLRAAIESRNSGLSRGLRAAELQAEADYEKWLDAQSVSLSARLQEAKTRWQKQLAVYQMARRNRELLDRLRSKEMESYNREMAKREQKMIDEMFLARRERRR